ncbi:hypothetical protein CK203_017346 [Vitis vinifera]|uniref:Uncharacterized protein n=1 Tax=Vitis vinifera TaxID=29760 RepID=A0A438JZJ0_VITVI|nr:hypothetical protein CK203_017346 [Vitis vinifera]
MGSLLKDVYGAAFNRFLGLPVEGFEEEIQCLLRKMEARIGGGALNLGANDGEKGKLIKSVIRMQKVDLICLLETKVQEVSLQMVRSLGIGRFLDWGAMEAQGGALWSILRGKRPSRKSWELCDLGRTGYDARGSSNAVKLKALIKDLKLWNKEVFGNVLLTRQRLSLPSAFRILKREFLLSQLRRRRLKGWPWTSSKSGL